MLAALVFISKPVNIPYFSYIDQEAGAWFGMTLAIVGAVFLVGSTLSSMREDILRSIGSVVSNLNGIEDKLDIIRVGAMHSIQEFTSKDFTSEHKGYEIYYENRHFYIRGVNAHFFTRIGAESWIDETELMRKNPTVL
jgi:hypothetical protein